MISNYRERILLFDHMMSMADPVTIGVKTLKIDREYSLEKRVY